MKLRNVCALGLAAALALSLGACGGGDGTGGDDTATNDTSTSTPKTLRVVATSDLDHLDPTMVGLVDTNNVTRVLTRQLISYEASNDPAVNVVPQPDLAAALPTLSDDGLTYTFTLRDGITWDAPGGARAITADDIIHGIMRVCSPLSPSFAASYFYSIEGFEAFCAAYGESPTVEEVKNHILNDSVAGLSAPDDKTVVITLTEPTSDFIYVLSLDVASPIAVEALDYEPDSPAFRENFIASGPYKVEEYIPDMHLYMVRNPSWNADSDPLRAAIVDRIEITFGVSADNAIQQIQSNDADLGLGIPLSAAQLQQLQNEGLEDQLITFTAGNSYFLWINTLTTNNNSALQKLEVRQALQYAVNKANFVQQLGGAGLAQAATGIFGAGVVGYSPNDPYDTPDKAGDPELAAQMLAAAGASDLTLKLAYRADHAVEVGIAQTVQQDMALAGITVELVPVPSSDYYPNFMMVKENGYNGEWDIALCGWSPDWAGGAARSVFQPQFQYLGIDQSYNYTNYNNDAANAAMAEALAAPDAASAEQYWIAVNDAVMADPPVIPLYSRLVANVFGPDVVNYQVFVLGQNADWSNVDVNR